MRLQPAGVDVLQADGAVVVRCVGNTFVGFASWEAEPTGVTVAELVTTSSPGKYTWSDITCKLSP